MRDKQLPPHATCIEVTSPLIDQGRTYVCGPECPPQPVDPKKVAESVRRAMGQAAKSLIFNTKAHEAMEAAGPPPGAEEQLTEWWLQLAREEIQRTVPKAVEYSATDLADIGHQIARTAGRKVSDEEAAELGVYFYLVGKLARWTGAVTQGERPSDDTIFDMGVYIRMVQRIRATGGWPGINQEDK
jgi:hypothetical protein